MILERKEFYPIKIFWKKSLCDPNKISELKQKIVLIFQKFKFENTSELENLLRHSYKNDIKLFMCEIKLKSPINPYNGSTKTTVICVDKWDIMSESGHKDISWLQSLTRILVDNSFSPSRIVYNSLYELKTISGSEILLQMNMNLKLQEDILFNLRQAAENIEEIDDRRINIYYMSQKLEICLSDNDAKIKISDWVKKIIIRYAELRTFIPSISLNPEEINNHNKEHENLEGSFLNDYGNWSWLVRDAQLSAFQTTTLFHFITTFKQVTLIDSKFTVSGDTLLNDNLKYDNSNIEQLIIENTIFLSANDKEFLSQKDEGQYSFMAYRDELNISSYCLFYILIHMNLLSNLRKIVIKLNDFSFKKDLFKL